MSISFEQYYKGISPIEIDRSNFQVKLNYNATLTTTSGDLGINLGNANTWTAEQTITNAGVNPLTIEGNGTNPSIEIYDSANASYSIEIGQASKIGAYFSNAVAGDSIIRGNYERLLLGVTGNDYRLLISSTYQVLTKNNTLDDGSGNMTIAGNLSVTGTGGIFATANTWTAEQTFNNSIYFTGQGGGAYISENMNLHFPNATSTYTWNLSNSSDPLFTVGIGSGNAGDVTLYNRVFHNGFSAGGFGIPYIIDTGSGTYSNGAGDIQLWSFYNGGNYMLRISYFYFVDSFTSTASLPSLNVSATDLSGNRYTRTFLDGNNIGEDSWETMVGFVYAEGGTTTNGYLTSASGTYTINYGYMIELLQV